MNGRGRLSSSDASRTTPYRPAVVAVARAANAAYFLVAATYCILTYNSFAYQQFIRPRLVSSLSGFVAFHHLWHWVLLGLTVLTLIPTWRSRPGRPLAIGYVAAMAGLGLVLVYRPLLPSVENDALGLYLACAFLVPPIWIAWYDHVSQWRAFRPEATDLPRILTVAAVAAVGAWLAGTATIPLRLDELGDLPTSPLGLTFGAATSLLVHVIVFVGVAAVVAVALGAIRRVRHGGRTEYVCVATLALLFTTAIVARLVFSALSFTGAVAWGVALEVALALTLTWSASAVTLGAPRAGVQAFGAWLAPVPGAGSRVGALIGLAVLPVVAFAAIGAAERFDWNFLVQNLCVLLAWACGAALVHGRLGAGVSRRTGPLVFASVVAVSAVGATGITPRLAPSARPFVPEFALDAYAAVEPSYRLLRHVLATEPPGSAAFFEFVAGHTLIQHVEVQPVDISFAEPLGPAPVRPPHIFLFVIDSLRRDYLSPYNPKVSFTPAFEQFARDEFAFQRNFTRYGGTGLSMPAIWSGSMILHKEYVQPFSPINALEKLLKVNRYLPVMSMDHITAQIIEPGTRVEELDRGRAELDYDFCATLEELTGRLSAGLADQGPVFAHTRSLNLHVSHLTARDRIGANDPAYGGFQVPAAAAVRRMDGCFGRFVESLKAQRLYDDSIVIVTADHGDALGEARRWGHAYTLFPEIVRTPLLVHIPARLRASLSADVEAASYSTDITPSLYALLGYDVAPREWPYGRPLFVAPGTDQAWRRSEETLLASSYGPVYGVLSDNGRALYIADGVNARDYAYDMTDLKPVRVGVTASMRTHGRAFIRERLDRLARMYRYSPRP